MFDTNKVVPRVVFGFAVSQILMNRVNAVIAQYPYETVTVNADNPDEGFPAESADTEVFVGVDIDGMNGAQVSAHTEAFEEFIRDHNLIGPYEECVVWTFTMTETAGLKS